MSSVKSPTCGACKYKSISTHDEPCVNCMRNTAIKSSVDYFTTTVKIPPVKPPKDEINHPSRYAGGQYECIDVMVDVFGVEAVKHFCLLNSFKYIWRAEHKNGVEDIKKANWYLNKYVELSEG